MNVKKVIVVDDDAAILDSLEIMLDFEGFQVSAYERGSEIIKLVEKQKDALPDVILLDMWLSDEDGREICKQLKSMEVTKDIPVIIMSASRGLKNTAISSGANAFISKPFDVDDVVKTLHQFTA